MRPDDACPRAEQLPRSITEPLTPPLVTSSVYDGRDLDTIDALYEGRATGYLYGRDGHPNGDLLAEKCRELHGSERAIVCGSGMAALSAVALAILRPGDRVVLSNQLYGRSQTLWTDELARFGVVSRLVDTCDHASFAEALREPTRLIVVETISNPLLRVADLAELARMAHATGAELLVDNTFACPLACRPFELGADWVMESLTKVMTGHSDVVLGLLAGRAAEWERVPHVVKTWGLGAEPFSCWQAARGIGTLAVRFERSCANAVHVARFLETRSEVESVAYPGLPTHPEHELARRLFGEQFGTIVTFRLPGGRAAVERFLSASGITLAPSLGDLSTTVSHPATTSHRGLTADARAALGITDGTLRLSVGIESVESIVERLNLGFCVS